MTEQAPHEQAPHEHAQHVHDRMPSGRTAPSPEALGFWEELYGQRDRIWSGRANKVLVDVAGSFEPGRALDLGSGEGGDSMWLAERSWQVTGVDLSPTALARAHEEALSRGIPNERITWQQADLAQWQPEGEFELVSACFLHAPSAVAFPRDEVLRRASEAVTLGGRLLVVGHMAFPAGSAARAGSGGADAHSHDDEDLLPTPDEVLAGLNAPGGRWQTVISEVRSREAVHDGQSMMLDDSVLLLQRIG